MPIPGRSWVNVTAAIAPRSPASSLDTIDANVPAELDVHPVGDHYATHKNVLIQRWLAKRPRYQMRFTPTSASWLDLVERWFTE